MLSYLRLEAYLFIEMSRWLDLYWKVFCPSSSSPQIITSVHGVCVCVCFLTHTHIRGYFYFFKRVVYYKNCTHVFHLIWFLEIFPYQLIESLIIYWITIWIFFCCWFPFWVLIVEFFCFVFPLGFCCCCCC